MSLSLSKPICLTFRFNWLLSFINTVIFRFRRRLGTKLTTYCIALYCISLLYYQFIVSVTYLLILCGTQYLEPKVSASYYNSTNTALFNDRPTRQTTGHFADKPFQTAICLVYIHSTRFPGIPPLSLNTAVPGVGQSS